MKKTKKRAYDRNAVEMRAEYDFFGACVASMWTNTAVEAMSCSLIQKWPNRFPTRSRPMMPYERFWLSRRELNTADGVIATREDKINQQPPERQPTNPKWRLSVSK